jgi:hypothetical protein
MPRSSSGKAQHCHVKFFHWLTGSLTRTDAGQLTVSHTRRYHPRCPCAIKRQRCHLILECPFSPQTWHKIISWLWMTYRTLDQDASHVDWWLSARQGTPKLLQKGLAFLTLLMPWMNRKQRNECISEGARPPEPLGSGSSLLWNELLYESGPTDANMYNREISKEVPTQYGKYTHS